MLAGLFLNFSWNCSIWCLVPCWCLLVSFSAGLNWYLVILGSSGLNWSLWIVLLNRSTGLFLWLFITSLVSGLNIRFQSLHKAQISELLVLNFNIFRMLSPFCNLFFSWIVPLMKSGWGIVVIAIPPDLCDGEKLPYVTGSVEKTMSTMSSIVDSCRRPGEASLSVRLVMLPTVWWDFII